eukprot:TRINITY_DN42_c1_g1_i1.p1 TRINITY_DN42_c1_g1~~TRINITY_DN42_c1_g1_i1.p1  ORF type:complete len:440 (+),score=142.14 TRINITY_DN42_c1_g1_i1:73-1392(+)
MGGGDDGKGGGKRHPKDFSGGKPYAFKALCSDALVAALMGSRGSVKDALQQETGCKIIAGDRGEFYPGTNFRVVIIFGDTPDAILPVLDHLISSIGELAEKEQASGQPVHESESFFGKEPGEYIFRLAICTRHSGGIIGHGGANIQALRQENGAKVFIENDRVGDHQMVRVIAKQQGLRSALARLNETIQKESEGEEWFKEWMLVRDFHGENAVVEKAGGKASRKGEGKGAKGTGAVVIRARNRSRSPRRGGGDLDEAPGDDVSRVLASAAAALAPQVLDAEHTITCMMPKEKVSAMIGTSGSHVKMVRNTTGAKIKFEDPISQDEVQQTLVISGPMLSVYTAHALLMKRYHDEEMDASGAGKGGAAAAETGGGGGGGGGKAGGGGGGGGHHSASGGGGIANVDKLQQQLLDLQKQLAAVQQGQEAKGKGKSKGKSKKR